jgi:O-antigen ligase
MALPGGRLESMLTAPGLEERLRDYYRQGLFLLIVLAVWVSTKPFLAGPTDDAPAAGDLVNQLTFSGLAGLSLLGVLMADRRALTPLLQPSYVLMVAWMFATTVMSTHPAVSQRAFAFTMIVMFLASALFVLPRRFADFERLLFIAAALVMGLSYAGIVLAPDLAMHTDFDRFEPEHAGSWKGHFDHKNIAGAMMGALACVGIYGIRTGRARIGTALLVGGVAFLYFTKSKTSLGLFPLTVVCCLLAERIPSLALRFILCLGPIAALLQLTLGSAALTMAASAIGPSAFGEFAASVGSLNRLVMPDPSFTGRFDIWRYGIEMAAHRPFSGYGYEAFWRTPTTLTGESHQELSWEVEQIIHGHNGYLDVLLTQGMIGLAIVIVVFLLKPVADYHRATRDQESRPLASMFLMIWMFISLGQCLEVYYFRRADPVWFALLIAVLGLRFTAAFRIDRSPSRAGPSS